MTSDCTQAWQKCWHEGFAPLLSDEGLFELAKALREDDPKLIQGHTCITANGYRKGEVIGACAISYAGWKGDELTGWDEVEAFFSMCCWKVDQSFGMMASCRYFLNWFDETPRFQMRKELLAEVQKIIEMRLTVSRETE